MTTREFSDQFDILFNSVTSDQAPGLNEYEKSVFLTKAQSQLINEYFNNRTDGVGGGFDGSERRQYDFSSLIRTEKLFDINTFKERIDNTEKLDKRSKVFLFPQNYFLSVNEILSDAKYQYSVIPLNYSEYQRLMLKPYNFPVKKGAWRLFTDKKNCNYYREQVSKVDEFGEDVNTDIDYVFLSGWADQKRNMEVTIRSIINSETIKEQGNAIEVPTITYFDGRHPKVYVNDDTISFYAYHNNKLFWRKITTNSKWKDDNTAYTVNIEVRGDAGDKEKDLDDEGTIELLKLGFTLMDYYIKSNRFNDESKNRMKDWDTVKTATHTDGFQMCSAPSKFTAFQSKNEDDYTIGKTFVTRVVQAPIAEVIGKFHGNLDYQLRYIKTLSPIILDNLDNYGDDLTIEGITQITECELPQEAHQEILERAVTLAKIAWQGGTLTQAASQQSNNNN